MSLQTSPFDDYAAAYDAEFTDSPLGRVLRRRVWSRLDISFSEGQRVLELGCGTGEDALHLCARGVHVVATDASPEMIAIAQHKAGERGLRERIELQALVMEQVVAAFPTASFDGVFSNFGAINCVRDPRSLSAGIARLLRPGGRFIAVIMGRRVPWEWLWYLGRGSVNQAFRRYRREGIQWRGLQIAYPTPAEFSAVLRSHFDVKGVAPLGWALPPSYAAGWINRSPRLLSALNRLESLGERSALLASCADHYIVEALRH
jgi:SAM-dependent methyltransferase